MSKEKAIEKIEEAIKDLYHSRHDEIIKAMLQQALAELEEELVFIGPNCYCASERVFKQILAELAKEQERIPK